MIKWIEMKKSKIIWVTVLIIAIMCLWPPWIERTHVPLRGYSTQRIYCSIIYPPRGMSAGRYSLTDDVIVEASYSIDLTCLFVQCGVVVLFAGTLLYQLSGRGKTT